MIVVDASVWVSHFTKQDNHHLTSLRWLTHMVNQQTEFLLPPLLLSEVAGAIARRTGVAELGHHAVGQILTTPRLRVISIDSVVGQLAAQLAADLRLRGADAIYVAVAHQYQASLVSWDREQIQRSASMVTAFAPSL